MPEWAPAHFLFRVGGGVLSVEQALERVRPTFEAVLDRRGLQLVEVTLGREAPGRILRVTVERVDGNVTLGEIAEVSEEISRALDLEDPIEVPYTLEVASPGIERPLTRPAHYARFEGQTIKVRAVDPIEGRRNFKGRIVHSGEESFVLELQHQEHVEIPYISVARANLVADWAQELRRAR